jgi:hypothetical protein
MENLYDYLLHYNHYTKLWNGVPRELVNEYWNDKDIDGVIKSKNINTLIELISKGDSFIKSIK